MMSNQFAGYKGRVLRDVGVKGGLNLNLNEI